MHVPVRDRRDPHRPASACSPTAHRRRRHRRLQIPSQTLKKTNKYNNGSFDTTSIAQQYHDKRSRRKRKSYLKPGAAIGAATLFFSFVDLLVVIDLLLLLPLLIVVADYKSRLEDVRYSTNTRERTDFTGDRSFASISASSIIFFFFKKKKKCHSNVTA
jgi:hypothetical protein